MEHVIYTRFHIHSHPILRVCELLQSDVGIKLSQFLKLQKKSVTCDQHGQMNGGSGYSRQLVRQGGGVQFC